MAKFKIAVALCLMLLILFSLPSYSKSKDGLTIIKSSTKSFVFEYTPQQIELEEHEIDGRIYLLPNIDGAFNRNILQNSPQELRYEFIINVPSSDGFQLSNSSIILPKETNGLMKPVAQTNSDNGTISYKANDNLYKSYKPQENITITYLGIALDVHIARVSVIAAYYSPITSSVVIPGKVSGEITFRSEKSKPYVQSLRNGFTMSNAVNGNIWGINENSEFNNQNTILSQPESIKIGNAIKIEIEETGIYKIDASQLSSAGANITAGLVPTVKVYSAGGKNLSVLPSDASTNAMNEIEIITLTKSNGDLDAIILYAEGPKGLYNEKGKVRHYINPYTFKTNLVLTWGDGTGKRATAVEPPQGSVSLRPNIYHHAIFENEELICPYPYGGGITFFGRSFFGSPFVNMLHNLDRSGSIRYKFSLAHSSEGNEKFEVFENNNLVSTLNLGSTPDVYTHARRAFREIEVPASSIASDNRSVLRFQYSGQNKAGSIGYFDYYEIHYPRTFIAINNELQFFTNPSWEGIAEFDISGFNSDKVYGFDITNPRNPKLLKNLNSSSNMFTFKDELTASELKSYYFSSKLKTAKLSTIEIKGLRSEQTNAQMIIVTSKELLQSATEYRDYRQEQTGMKIQLVTLEEIYNEFSAGNPDLVAIRDYISWAHTNWSTKPEFVLLWGGGHYDARNIQSKSANYIPAWQQPDTDLLTFNEINDSWASEDIFGRIVGDDVILDIAVGRITVNSNAEGKAVLDKTRTYENNSSNDGWRTNILMLADDGLQGPGSNPETPMHTNQTDDIYRNHLPAEFQAKLIHMIEYPVQNVPGGRKKPEVTNDIINHINTQGSLIVNYIGHGNPRVWAHEEVLERNLHIPMLTNYDKLFFCVAATCDYGRYDHPEIRAGAEEFVISQSGAAIGIFSATRVVYSHANAALAYSFYKELFKRNPETMEYPTVGAVSAIAKNKNIGHEENTFKFFLLGDPSLRLNIPNLDIVIESINDKDLASLTEPVKLKALSEVKVTGFVKNAGSSNPDASFNGTVIITLRDSDFLVSSKETGNPFIFTFTKAGAALNRSVYPVVDGRFEATFIIPKDISYSENNGKLYAYAFSDDSKYAMGSNNQLVIDGMGTTGSTDDEGPEIKIYFDSRQFSSGQTVSRNPLLIVDLFDNSGINTTGLGIGRGIEAWIDDNPYSINLTDKFTPSLKDNRYGSVEMFMFGLSPGEHTITIRAWDVYNNHTTSSVKFVIPNDDDLITIESLLGFPNPFYQDLSLEFTHNASPPFTATVEIYNINGGLIRSFTRSLASLHTSVIELDSKDSNGNTIAEGVYTATVKIVDNYGRQSPVKAVMLIKNK